MIVDIGVFMIAQRLAVNTKYAFWEYKGKADESLIIFSSEGNENLQNAEKLGKDVCNGKRVFAGNRIAGYHILPLESGPGCKVTYIALSEKSGVPDWIFKKILPGTLAKVSKKSFK